MKNSVTKRVFSVLLTAILLLGTLPVLSLPTFAASKSDLTFELNDDEQSYEVSACYRSAIGEVVIPSEYDGKPVTKIGDRAFKDCKKITSVTIPNSVIEIGSYVFWQCEELKSATITGTVTEMAECVFLSCTSLESVTLPNNIKEISFGMFKDCTSLESVSIPNGVTAIGGSAFEGCTSLTSVTMPDSVTAIGWGAFQGCTGLKQIKISDNVAELDNYVFQNCTSLTSITIPKSVTTIDSDIFSGCTGLKEILVSPDNNNYISQDGVLFDKAKKELLKYPSCKAATNYTVPETVAEIKYRAFEGNKHLTSVTIPACVEKINSGAFSDCNEELTVIGYTYSAAHDYAIKNSIKFNSIGQSDPLRYKLNNAGTEYWVENCSTAYSGEIVIPSVHNGKPVTFIGKEAFCGCSNLTSVIISNGVTRICEEAFLDCYGLEHATIPNTVTAIETLAFASCEKLSQIEIPDSVTFLAGSAFSGCGIEKIVIPKNVSTIYDYEFDDWNGEWVERGTPFNSPSFKEIIVSPDNEYFSSEDGVLFNKDKTLLISYPNGKSESTYAIPDGVTVIGAHALGNGNLESVKIPDGVTEIGAWAFSGSENLKGLKIPNSVTKIGDGAFFYCKGLESIEIPDGVLAIGDETFDMCKNLKEVILPDSITDIGSWAFSGCESLESINIPASVTDIGYDAFEDCTSLKNIEISDNIMWNPKYLFGDTAYYNDKSNWEDGVLYIGKVLVKADENISGDYTVKSGTKTIAADSFFGCKELTSVTIPNSVTCIGYDAFSLCKGLTEITVPDEVTYIGRGAFSYCDNLASITVPDSVMNLEESTFSDTAYYKNEANWKDGVLYVGNHLIKAKETVEGVYSVKPGTKTIATSAFDKCTKITEIKIPDSVVKIGEYVFSRCNALEKITVSPQNSFYCSQNGVLFNKAVTELIIYPEAKTDKAYVIPDGVTTLSSSSFNGCENIASVKMPDSLTLINMSAFNGCKKLKSMVLPNGLTFLGRAAFSGCESLVSVVIPNTVTHIDYGVFMLCKNLVSVTMPDNLTSMGWSVFSGCESLEYVKLPERLGAIQAGVFWECKNLKSITIPESVDGINGGAFMGSGLETIYGCKGSYAEEYASENGYKFVAIADLKNSEFNISVKGEVDYTAALEVKLLSSDKSKITYDITLTKDGKAIQPDGTVTVKIPVPESLDGAKCRVYRVEENGKNTDMNAEFKDGFMVFKTTHFSKYILTTDDLSVVYGDINGDGKINTVDLAMLRKYLANKDPATGESSVSVGAGADVNGDGKINTVDLALLRKYLANKDPVTGESSVTLGPR